MSLVAQEKYGQRKIIPVKILCNASVILCVTSRAFRGVLFSKKEESACNGCVTDSIVECHNGFTKMLFSLFLSRVLCPGMVSVKRLVACKKALGFKGKGS